MARETTESSFDELASGLARGTLSRRKALRLMGAALFGGALASVPGAAWASHKGTPHGGGGGGGGGKSACAKYCKTLFGGDTADQEECVSQGAQGAGPCYECTPGIGGGPNFVTPVCPSGEFNTQTCECPALPPDACPGVECGSCFYPDPIGSVPCHCATLVDGTGAYCYFGGVSARSCADCVNYPGTVCVHSSGDVACVRPCPDGQVCPE